MGKVGLHDATLCRVYPTPLDLLPGANIMPQVLDQPPRAAEQPQGFVERRSFRSDMPPAHERRQFANSYEGLSPDAGDLARAIDEYKLMHRRRFITYEEMLQVITGLGYHK